MPVINGPLGKITSDNTYSCPVKIITTFMNFLEHNITYSIPVIYLLGFTFEEDKYVGSLALWA